jgi:hypothetical protein
VFSKKYLCFVLPLILLGKYFLASAIATTGVDFWAGQDPLGEPLETWAIKYWKWWMTVPNGFESDKCVMYSTPDAPVIFLANSYATDYQGNCSITSDKYILVPLLVGECDPSLPDLKGNTTQDLWNCARSTDEYFQSWDVVLDDKIITRNWGNEKINPDLIHDILVRNSTTFVLDIAKDNVYAAPEGSWSPAVVDGYYLVLKPLNPGEHSLTYKIIHEPQYLVGTANTPKIIEGSAVYNLRVN